MISHMFLGASSMQRRGLMLLGEVCMSNTNCNSRYLNLTRLLVTNHVCDVFVIVLLCYAI